MNKKKSDEEKLYGKLKIRDNADKLKSTRKQLTDAIEMKAKTEDKKKKKKLGIKALKIQDTRKKLKKDSTALDSIYNIK